MKKSGFERVMLVAGAAVLAVGLVSCGGGGDDDTGDDGPPANSVATNTTSASGSTATKPPADDDDDAEEIEVSMKDNFFEPKNITVGVGETVTIVAKNDGLAVHNMVVLGTQFKSDQLVMAGDESSFDVKFEKAGEYKFQCDYHVPDMVGTITVK